MRKIKFGLTISFILLAMVTLCLPSSEIAAKAEKLMPDLIKLDDYDKKNTVYAGDRGIAYFDHNQHVAADKCVTCHHTNSKSLTKAVEEPVLKCIACHKKVFTTNEIEGTNEDKKFKGLMAFNSEQAFHGWQSEIGCIGCHTVRKIKPTYCYDCHTPKKAKQIKNK